MKFGAAFWINRTSWADLRDACLAAEAAGWDSIWVDDHLLADEGDPTDAKLEGWATLAALATLTTRARLGLLVGANTFRNPGPDRQARDDHRPPVRRSLGARTRRRLVRTRARRLRHRLRRRVRRTARQARRSGRAHPPPARRRTIHPPGPLLRDARRAGRSPPRPATAADPDRRLRPDEDPAHDRPLRRHVERIRAARADRRGERDAPRALRRDRPPVRRHRANRHHPHRRPRHDGRCHGRLGRDGPTPRHRRARRRRRHEPRPDRRRPAGDRRPRTSTATATSASAKIVFVFRAPFDFETIGRVGELRS